MAQASKTAASKSRTTAKVGRPAATKSMAKTAAKPASQVTAAKAMTKVTAKAAGKKDNQTIRPLHNWVWIFNLVFLTLCLSSITRQLGFSVMPGAMLGIISALTLVYLRNSRGLAASFIYASRANTLVLLAGILIASYFLWDTLLTDSELLISEHTVTLFFLLGLSSTGALLKLLGTEYDKEQSVELRLRHMMGGPSLALSFCVAGIATGLLLLVFYTIEPNSGFAFLKVKFLERGIIPPLCLILFFWGGALLLGKYSLSLRNLRLGGVGEDDSPLLVELWSEFRKSARVGKNDSLPTKFVDLAWQANENFYLFPRYINWAIPIIGFIGTVLGISLAAGEIGNIVGSSSLNIGDSIGSAMEPLGIAFDTTLIALSLSVCLALAHTLLQRWEEQKFLFFEDFIGKIK